ncbi:MAG: bifunctional phosphopantothenoylcysteine decarboxylase/phosphopantothenate--cysteine ligase CoaBC [Methanospirillum sp.]|uniref:bifunctional phosphopantothenoylcysteine decarboxylase/phosphopantothenate--cysteine ligase CoaBC n=1 Tax=Methanospirillum sp. TaxID=45200 RepID=UPI002372AEB2|nr:bifunctional phosphopantothenoylcysteine decarboxylase/phosphopantothenate--cysteine ligase CoaBC [Methanospirillum sp.]MDD1729180.1 bifunctional phosphopantothenoylcysteine decarboxylase/phosphopantothenate--cysteine ligase CoaBC [Methanospirillum sp.]
MNTLQKKTILLAVTGSIAAVETIKLAHALKRRGAIVQAVMSEAAMRIVHPDALTYACGRETITRITGLVEHVQYCGDEREADLLLIAPCTANTISKIACGIDDTPVTTCATTALGSRMPIIIVPAMHHAMFRHTGVIGNLERLKSWGIPIIGPRIEEGKAKIADIDEIVLACERELNGKPLSGMHVLVTSGRCDEPVDDVRVLTTRSSGRMGQELAKAAFRLGAEVTIVHRDHLPGFTNVRTSSAESMLHAVSRIFESKHIDLYISAAAVSDYAPVRYDGKIPSGQRPVIKLEPLPKILDLAIGKATLTVAFKLGVQSTEEASALLKRGVTLVAANKPDTMGAEEGVYQFIDKDGILQVSGSKEDIAHQMLDRIIQRNNAGHSSNPGGIQSS